MHSYIYFITKEVIFGDYSQKVDVKKVYVKYIGELDPAGSSTYGLQMQYTTNGSDVYREFSSPTFTNSTTVATASFVPATASQARNIHSIRFRIIGKDHTSTPPNAGDSRGTMKILQIGIIYRTKMVK